MIIKTLRFNHSHKTVTLRLYDKKTRKVFAKFRSVPLSNDDFTEIYSSGKVNSYLFENYFFDITKI